MFGTLEGMQRLAIRHTFILLIYAVRTSPLGLIVGGTWHARIDYCETWRNGKKKKQWQKHVKQISCTECYWYSLLKSIQLGPRRRPRARARRFLWLRKLLIDAGIPTDIDAVVPHYNEVDRTGNNSIKAKEPKEQRPRRGTKTCRMTLNIEETSVMNNSQH